MPQEWLHENHERVGDHLLTCPRSARSTFVPVIRRHDAHVRLLAEDLRAANRSPRIEPRDTVRLYKARPDILALGTEGGEDIIDVMVCHHFAAYPDFINPNYTKPPNRLIQRRAQKIKRYRTLKTT